MGLFFLFLQLKNLPEFIRELCADRSTWAESGREEEVRGAQCRAQELWDEAHRPSLACDPHCSWQGDTQLHRQAVPCLGLRYL